MSPCCARRGHPAATGGARTSDGCSRRGRSPSSGARGSAGGWWRRTGRWASPGRSGRCTRPAPTVAGERAYPRVADLPGVPDAAFVAVPAPACAAVVAELAALGLRRGGRLQLGLRRDRPGGRGTAACAARRRRGRCRCSARTATGWSTTPTRVLIWPDQHGGVALAAGERGVAVVSQSSSIAISVTMADIGLPLALRRRRRQRRAARRGGRSAAALLDVRAGLRGRDDRRVARGPARLGAAGRLRAGPPDRPGRAGARAAARRRGRRSSRTPPRSRATPRPAAEFLRRNGIGQVDSVDALLGALCLLHCGGPLPDTRLTSLVELGGRGGADRGRRRRRGRALRRADAGAARASCARCSASGWRWPTRSTTTPTSGATRTRWRRRSRRWSAAPRTCTCSSPTCRAPTAAPTTTGRWPSTAFARACATADARGALVAAMAANLTGGAGGRLGAPGAGGARPARRRRWRRSRPRPTIGRAWAGPARAARSPARAGGSAVRRARTVLNEATSKRLLRVHGVPVPDGAVCASAGAAVVAAADLAWPGRGEGRSASPTRPSTTPSGSAWSSPPTSGRPPPCCWPGTRRCWSSGSCRAGSSSCWSGVQSDPVFGPVLSLGVGGVLTELVRDVAHLLLPVDARRDPPGPARPALRPAAHRLPGRAGRRPRPASSTSSAGWPSWCWPRRRWSRWRSTR